MKPKSALRYCLLLAAAAQLVASSSASAADGTWIQTGAGPFDWSVAATANWSGGTVADGQNNTANFTANITAAQTVNLAEARTIGNITFTDSTTDSHNLTISGANILTLDRSSGIPTINVTQSARTLTISSEIAGLDGLLKIGLGTLTLTGANSYTGTTTITQGTLNLGGATANGSLASTVLNLGGGTLSYTRTGSTTQSFTTTNIQPGVSTASTVAGNTLNLGDLTRDAGGTLNFGNTGSINTSEANDSTGILGAWATFNGADWAINNGSGVAAYTGYDTLAGTTLASAGTVNYRVATNPTTPTGNITMDATGTIDANTLRISDAAARTIDVRNGTTQGILRFGAVGGLLTSGGTHTIGVATTAGTITAGGAADTAGELIVNNATALTINSVIANNGSGAVSLTKSGAGALTLIATNSLTGNTTINAGQLSIGSNNSTGARLGPATYAGNIFIAGGASLIFNANESQTLSGIISGDGSLQKAGGGTTTLSGNNTYTGKTTVAGAGGGGPGLSVSSFNSVVGGTSSSSLGAPTTVANGTIDLGSGSNTRSCTLIYTGAGETTDRVMNVSFNTGAKHTITSNATSGGLLKFTSTFTIVPSSGSTTAGLNLRGSGKGEIAQMGSIPGILEKLDAGAWTLNGTNSANLCTISAGTLILNGSFTAKNATPTFSVNGTSTLGGSGTLTATTAGTAIVTVAAGANLTPGTSTTVGTLTVDGTLNIAAMAGGAGVINMDLDTIAASDKVVTGPVNIGTGTLGMGNFVFTALSGLENGTYKLITSSGITGSLDAANLTGPVGTGTGTLQINGNDIELVVSGVGGAPEIAVEQPEATDIVNGGSKGFGPVAVGSNTPLIFTIRNTGSADLNLTSSPKVIVGGANPGDFSLTVAPSSPVTSSGGTTTFTVQFAPTATGLRSATLTIANNDPDEGSFVINVDGTGQTPYEAWAGSALFEDDANNDGVDNGFAFLLGAASPTASVPARTFTESSGNLTMTFTARNDASRGSATLNVQHSSDLGIGDPWASAPVTDAGSSAVGVTFSVTPGSPNNTVTATISNSESNAGKLFGRLQAAE